MRQSTLPILAFVILSSFRLANSQSFGTSIEGVVTDVNKVPVPNATVTAHQKTTSYIETTSTNDEGRFWFRTVRPGEYSITAEASGLECTIDKSVSAGEAANVNLNLPCRKDKVDVFTSDAVISDASRTAVGNLLNSRYVKNVPLVSRNILNLIPLQPGVNGRFVPDPRDIDLSVAGLSRRLGYQVDGSSNNHFFRSGSRLNLLSETAIQEVQLMTTGYPAECGGTAGGIVNLITRSGTNDLNGTFSVLYRPSELSAKPFEFVPGTDQNISAYGTTGALGGPIVRDRWYYFASYEWTRRHYVVPITIMQDVRAQLVTSGLSPSIFVNSRSTSDTYPYLDLRTDASVNGSTRLSLRYNYFFSDLEHSGPGGILTTDRSFGFSGPNYALSATTVTTFSEKALSEFRFQINGYTLRFAGDERTGKGPTVMIQGAAPAGFGPDPSIGQIAPAEHTVQFQENFTRVSGKHIFKLGGGVNFIADRQSAQLPSQYTFQTIQNYLDASSGSKPMGYSKYQESVGVNKIPDNAIYYNVFLQDDWILSHKIRLAIGLRYEYLDPPSGDPSAPLAISRTFNSDKDNFAPRAALAYRLRDGKRSTVARVSSGVYYDPTALITYRRALLNDGDTRYAAFTLSGSQRTNDWPEFPNRVGPDIPPPDLDTVAPDFKTMYAIRSSVQVVQSISEEVSVTVGYVNSVARHIPVYRNMNCLPTGRTLADGRPVYSTTQPDPNNGNGTIVTPCAIKLYPQFNIVKIAESGGNESYNGMFVQLTKRFAAGFQINANYTLSNSVDDAPEENGPAPLTLSDPSNRRTDRGSSRGDLTHVFNMSFVALPTITVGNRWLRWMLNGNQLSAIMIADSGETFNYTTNDINGDGVNGADRPVGVPRNAGRLPAYLGVDARYSRLVAVSHERSLEFYVEASNLFNRKQVSSYQATNLATAGRNQIVDPVTGLLLGPIPDRSTMSPLWRDSRQVQLGLKFHFGQ